MLNNWVNLKCDCNLIWILQVFNDGIDFCNSTTEYCLGLFREGGSFQSFLHDLSFYNSSCSTDQEAMCMFCQLLNMCLPTTHYRKGKQSQVVSKTHWILWEGLGSHQHLVLVIDNSQLFWSVNCNDGLDLQGLKPIQIYCFSNCIKRSEYFHFSKT